MILSQIAVTKTALALLTATYAATVAASPAPAPGSGGVETLNKRAMVAVPESLVLFQEKELINERPFAQADVDRADQPYGNSYESLDVPDGYYQSEVYGNDFRRVAGAFGFPAIRYLRTYTTKQDVGAVFLPKPDNYNGDIACWFFGGSTGTGTSPVFTWNYLFPTREAYQGIECIVIRPRAQ